MQRNIIYATDSVGKQNLFSFFSLELFLTQKLSIFQICRSLQIYMSVLTLRVAETRNR